MGLNEKQDAAFPFLFGGTFIEGRKEVETVNQFTSISLPFRRDFH